MDDTLCPSSLCYIQSPEWSFWKYTCIHFKVVLKTFKWFLFTLLKLSPFFLTKLAYHGIIWSLFIYTSTPQAFLIYQWDSSTNVHTHTHTLSLSLTHFWEDFSLDVSSHLSLILSPESHSFFSKIRVFCLFFMLS